MNGTRTTSTDARGGGTAQWALRIVGALALLVMAGVHLQRLLGAGYDQIPTIGTLFWLLRSPPRASPSRRSRC